MKNLAFKWQSALSLLIWHKNDGLLEVKASSIFFRRVVYKKAHQSKCHDFFSGSNAMESLLQFPLFFRFKRGISNAFDKAEAEGMMNAYLQIYQSTN